MNDKVNIRVKFDKLDIDKQELTTSNGWTKNQLQKNDEQPKDRYFNNLDKVGIDISGFGAKISFNPNKIIGIEPAKGVLTYQQFRQSIEYVEEQLCEHGLKLNRLDKIAQVIAYHNSFDVIPNFGYDAYRPVFESIPTPNKLDRLVTQGTLYFQKPDFSKVVTIYDKTKESELDYNCIRFENRYNKIRSTKRVLLGSINEAEYYSRRAEQKSEIERAFFHAKITQKISNSWVYDFLIEHGNNCSLNVGLYSEIGKLEVSQYEPTYAINQLNNGTDAQRRAARRFVNATKEMYVSSNEYFLELYNELKTLFRGAA